MLKTSRLFNGIAVILLASNLAACSSMGGANVPQVDIGKSMTNQDQIKIQNALGTARTHQNTSWQDPNGNTYTITPTQTFANEQGQPCRTYTLTATINGQAHPISGTACRDSNGVWQVNNQ